MARARLSPEKWIAAGLKALVKEGPQALAAEPLARALETTKGSFYWHFKDVPAFQAALVEHWRSAALEALAASVASGGSADQRLRQLGRDVLSDRTEAALRTWAQTDPAVAAALRTLDRERLTYITLTLRELGLGNADFGLALQGALAGLPSLPGRSQKDRVAAYDTLVDTVLALTN